MLSIVPRVFVALTLALVVAGCGTEVASENPPEPNSGGEDAESQPAESDETDDGPDAVPVTARELIGSVVRIEMWVDGEYFNHGSGTVISDDGLILTNAHVATPAEFEIDQLMIAVTGEPDEPPVVRYEAFVLASDVKLDLAVIRAERTVDGQAYDGALTPLPVADSDSVDIGDELLIIGYPAIGLETVTVTRGQISGFTGDPALGNRAWIKTDATISGGNSGGAAINAAGELVGVPTRAAAGEVDETGDIVDCRAVRDTNGDGQIDQNDDCVPLGGFLNGVRPTNLAREMISAVETGVAYEPVGDLPQPDPDDPEDPAPSDFDAADASFARPWLGDASPESETPQDLVWVDSSTQLCAWWEYSGMADGVTYDAIWAYEGEVLPEVSYLGEVWTAGETGDTWVCFTSENSLPAGIYDFALNVQGEYMNASFIAVGPEFAPVDVTIDNQSADQSICYVFISPDVMGFWGDDWLGAEEILEAGQSITFRLPPTTYDVLGQDCDRTHLFEDTFEITGDDVLTYE